MNKVIWVLIDGGMPGEDGCYNPNWNLAYPDMGRIATRKNGKEEMIGIEMSLFHKGISFNKTQHNYIGGICIGLLM